MLQAAQISLPSFLELLFYMLIVLALCFTSLSCHFSSSLSLFMFLGGASGWAWLEFGSSKSNPWPVGHRAQRLTS
jgi:hypothetical protein